MAKIISEDLENTYQIYKAVAENRMTIDEGYAKILEKNPEYNNNSFKMCANAFKGLLSGKLCKIHLSGSYYYYFAKRLGEEYGKDALERALRATYENVRYFYGVTSAKSNNIREDCQKLADEHHIDISFSEDMFKNMSSNMDYAIWIFQGNPTFYRIRDYIAENDVITWGVRQSQKQIKEGDKAYIWESGADAGIVACGTILCNPESRDNILDDPYSLVEGKAGATLSVDIEIEQRFLNQEIPRSVLKEDARMQKLEVLTYPGATNFHVKKAEDTVIKSIIDGTYKKVPLTETIEQDDSLEQQYWIFSLGENASMWNEMHQQGFMGIDWPELGDLKQYATKNAIREAMKNVYGTDGEYTMGALCNWQFANEMSEGDIVYAKKGKYEIVGRGIVKSEYIFDASRKTYQSTHKVEWTHVGSWKHPGTAAMKTLTNITSYVDYVEKIESLFDIEVDGGTGGRSIIYPAYTREEFLAEVFMEEETLDTMSSLLKRKKNIILQGAPGVGKTFAAKRIAYVLMGEQNESRIQMVQFHQSYSYEDFVMGYKPNGTGFELEYGPFYKFCEKAKDDLENDYYFIIDEINRGNMSKIFGELLMLIEADKRKSKCSVFMPYSKEMFYVPANVHIIGMMNTADRSLAMIDYALRRRFSFVELNPSFDSEGFMKVIETAANPRFTKLVNVIDSLNKYICKDELGSGFQIGHSYLCTKEAVDDHWVEEVIKYDILPLLSEYWFDEEDKYHLWENRLLGVIQ